MSLSPKLLILAGIIVAAMVYLVAYTMGGEGGVYYLELGEYMAKKPAHAVRIAGFVSDGSVRKDEAGLAVDFVLTDQTGTHQLPVRFDTRSAGGRIPDTFTDGSQVVISGDMGAAGTFQAKEMLAKCPSKYEAAPPTKRAG